MKLRPTDIGALCGILTLGVAWGYFGVRPIATRIGSMERDCAQTRLAISRGEDFVRGLDDLQTYLADFEQALADLDRLVPPQVDNTARLNEINNVATQCGLSTSMVRPDTAQPRGAVTAHPITVSIDGDYEHLLRFIFDVESLPRHTRVTRLEMSVDPASTHAVDAKLELTAYSVDPTEGGGSVSSLKDRMLADFKQSPGKAIFLAIGLFAAVVVWGPRLTASLAQPAPGAVGGTAEVAASDVLRDPASIRAAFIHVSDEAKLLRRYADPLDPGAVAHDPFEHEKLAGEQVAAAPVVETEPDTETVAEIETKTEADAAKAMRLNGVVIFKTGRGAVIDGEVVRVGGRVGPFTLTEVAERAAKVRGVHGTYALVMTTEENVP